MSENIIKQSRAEYDQLDRVNPSSLMYALTSRKHYWTYCNGQIEHRPSPAMEIGTLAHALILEPNTTDFAYWTGKVRRGKEWDEFQLEHAGQVIVRQKEMDIAARIAEAVRGHDAAAALLATCHTEMTIKHDWQIDGEHVLQCKGRIDAICPTHLVDVKTAGDIRPREFGRQCANLRYNVRLACYRYWYEQETNNSPNVYLIAVENTPPYDVVVYHVPDQFLDSGLTEAERGARLVCWGLKDDAWPGIAEKVQALEVPLWAMPDEELVGF